MEFTENQDRCIRCKQVFVHCILAKLVSQFKQDTRDTIQDCNDQISHGGIWQGYSVVSLQFRNKFFKIIWSIPFQLFKDSDRCLISFVFSSLDPLANNIVIKQTHKVENQDELKEVMVSSWQIRKRLEALHAFIWDQLSKQRIAPDALENKALSGIILECNLRPSI